MDIFEFPDVIPPDHTEFLYNNDDLLGEHKHQISWLRNHYGQKAAQLWGKSTVLKGWLKRSENYWGVYYASLENPLTKKPYGMEAGKALARNSDDYQNINQLWIATEVERRQILAYMDSLDDKSSFIPGSQGRLNRVMQLEGMDND